MMKKLIMLLFVLMLCVPVLAENTDAIPVEIVEVRAQNHIQVGLETALTTAVGMLPAQLEQYQSRAELVRMSDDGYRWIVTVFDLANLSDGWCIEIDASSGAVEGSYTTHDGYFQDIQDKWAAAMGKSNVKALWRMEEKALFDALYALQPAYGLPKEGDMSASEASERAAVALAPYYPEDKAAGYLACPGYIMGGEDCNGIWEIYMADNGQVVYQVNLDAVTGEIYYISSDDDGNG